MAGLAGFAGCLSYTLGGLAVRTVGAVRTDIAESFANLLKKRTTPKGIVPYKIPYDDYFSVPFSAASIMFWLAEM